MQFTDIFLLIFIFFLIFYLNKKFKKYKSVYCSNGLDGVLYYFLRAAQDSKNTEDYLKNINCK